MTASRYWKPCGARNLVERTRIRPRHNARVALTADSRHRARVLPHGHQAGVCLHVTSLPGDFGIGQIGAEARDFIDTLAAMRVRVWQFLPTGPTAWGDSPYQLLSSFAGNELLIDVEALRRARLLASKEIDILRSLPRDFVDFGRLIPVKQRLLSLAAARFDRRASVAAKAARHEFVEQNDARWLHDYALFRVLKTLHDERPWPDWERSFVQRDVPSLRRVEAQFAAGIDTVKTLQFLFHEQWADIRRYASAQGVCLFGDLPIYAALDGADAWSRRSLFRIDQNGHMDRVAGVPPDYFTEDGQLWGNPLYHWPNHEASAYEWWIARLRHAMAHADLVRVDHFRGFESFWTVPAGNTTARDGRWEPGPGNALFETARGTLGHLPIVAEDLGVITPEVDTLRMANGLPGMRVLQFDVADEHFDPQGYDENCVVYTGTHDNDTVSGWFHGRSDDTRSPGTIAWIQKRVLDLTGGAEETVHADLIRLALQSNAGLAIAPMQDYLGLGTEARLNTPGTSTGNWRWRMARPIAAVRREQIGEMIAGSGRGA